MKLFMALLVIVNIVLMVLNFNGALNSFAQEAYGLMLLGLFGTLVGAIGVHAGITYFTPVKKGSRRARR